MKNLKLLAALLALTIGLAGCDGSSKGGSPASSASKNMLDGDNMTAPSTQKQEYEEPEDVTYMRLLAGEDEYRACVLYLGGSYEVTTDVQKVLDSQTDLRDLWSFVYDIPEDHYVVSPDGGCDLYCIFPQDPQATLFVYEVSLTDDAENPLQRGKQLYYSEDGQPILLLCNISDIAPNTEVELYPTAGEEQPLPFRRERPCGGSRRRVRFYHLPGGGRLGDRLKPLVAGGQLAGDRPRHRRGLF